jgi:hypothetical protein
MKQAKELSAQSEAVRSKEIASDDRGEEIAEE